MKLNHNRDTVILIVGLGLLGGSYARALKKKGYTVTAVELRDEAIRYALQHGLIDRGTTRPEKNWFDEADLVVFALYPHVLLEWIETYAHLLRKGLFLTDVTGVKGEIVRRVQESLPDGVEFIAAHPMAGKEVGGIENSSDGIFSGANYIVVPTERNTTEGIEVCRELGRELGFRRVSVLSPEKHDEMIAFVSQLTHCIAVSLMCAGDDAGLVDYTGDSFRDLTRIARIQEELWSELFLLNRTALLEQMDRFAETFSALRRAIESEDADTMKEMMRLSTARRSLFDKRGEEV